MKETIERLEKGKWRVTIFRRANGSLGLDWEKYSDDPREMCWVLVGHVSETFCDSLETARREARERLDQISN